MSQTIKKPLVSVIISTYNRPQFLQRAVDSVLNQTFKEFEIIVIDDNSDQLPNLVLEKGENRVVPIRMPFHTGFWIRPRNVGIMIARSQYLCFLDDDNVYLPNHIELLYSNIKDDQFDMVYSDRVYKSFNPNESKFMGKMSFDFNDRKINQGNYIDISDIMITGHFMNEVGFFDTNWDRKADWLFMNRLAEHNSRVKHIAEVTHEYWWHDNNIGQINPLGGKFIHK
jgi:glycosyltransferase involved in cell wall biosynthesis